jgi:hypothetical protein
MPLTPPPTPQGVEDGGGARWVGLFSSRASDPASHSSGSRGWGRGLVGGAESERL